MYSGLSYRRCNHFAPIISIPLRLALTKTFIKTDMLLSYHVLCLYSFCSGMSSSFFILSFSALPVVLATLVIWKAARFIYLMNCCDAPTGSEHSLQWKSVWEVVNFLCRFFMLNYIIRLDKERKKIVPRTQPDRRFNVLFNNALPVRLFLTTSGRVRRCESCQIWHSWVNSDALQCDLWKEWFFFDFHLCKILQHVSCVNICVSWWLLTCPNLYKRLNLGEVNHRPQIKTKDKCLGAFIDGRRFLLKLVIKANAATFIWSINRAKSRWVDKKDEVVIEKRTKLPLR